MKLVKGMFGHEFGPKVDSAFGLSAGQMRCNYKVTHNSGWYNASGEKLGWGDLSSEDMTRIKENLDPNQVFIVLGEHDSFWNFVDHVGAIGSMSSITQDAETPGRNYVEQKMDYMITAKEVIPVVDRKCFQNSWEVGSLNLFPVLRPQAVQLMRKTTKQ